MDNKSDINMATHIELFRTSVELAMAIKSDKVDPTTRDIAV